MVSPRDVVSHLLERGLVSPGRVVEGDLVVTDASRRNQNLRVVSAHGPSFFVKHAPHPSGASLLRQEAEAYRVLQREGSPFARHVPALRDHDAGRRLLVTDLLVDGETVLAYHQRLRRFPPELGSAMGEALARLHRTPVPAAVAKRMPKTPPALFSLIRPAVSYVNELNPAGLQVVRIVQQSRELAADLDALASSWRREAFIHGDLKWDNCLLVGNASPPDLRIVDWELGTLGDPGWDVGSVFNDYLSYWLSSIPVTGQLPAERFLEMAAFPLDAMLPAIHAFWEAYATAAGLAPAERAERLRRAMGFAGARVAQTAFEAMQVSPQLTANAVCMLQLAHNVIRRPEEAATRLLRLPEPLEARA